MVIDITKDIEERKLLDLFTKGIEDENGICMSGLNVGVSRGETMYTTPHLINVKKVEKKGESLIQVTDYFETSIDEYLAANPDAMETYEDLDTMKDGIARSCTSYTYPAESVFFKVNHNNAHEICVNIAGDFVSWLYGDYTVDRTNRNATTNVLGITLHDKTPVEGYSVFVAASYCMEDLLNKDAEDLYERIRKDGGEKGGYIRQIGEDGKADVDYIDF
jgi:hypothetical protein